MDLVELGRYNTTTEASLVRARLEASGIESIVEADTAAGTFPTLAALGRVRVLVREEDRPDAMDVLERMLPAGD
ncbi:MAG: putative signal transducing protein [Acidimicrobiia bacterium]